MIGVAQARPPFIEFFVQAQPDTPRSLELGYRVTKDIDMVRIVQPGSRDDLLKEAKGWIKQLRDKYLSNAHDAYPEEWINAIENKYEMWKKGQDAPLNGTSVKEWPLLSPAQVQNLIACHLLTIEDVSEMTENAMIQYGMGARELKEKAREWLKGKEIASAALTENAELKKMLAELKAELDALKAEKPKRGRPKLQEAA